MSTSTSTKKMIIVAGIAFGVGLSSMAAMPANAATNGTSPSNGQCLVGSSAQVISHPEVSHTETTVVPGEAAVTEPQEIWGRDVSHLVYQFTRTNPGSAETLTNLYKFAQTIPAVDGTKTYEWTTTVVDSKVKYQYEKWVTGDVEAKTSTGWFKVGEFGWQRWFPGSYKETFDDVEVLESGAHNAIQGKDLGDGRGTVNEWVVDGVTYRQHTTAYKYLKSGKTWNIQVGSHQETQWASTSPGSGWTQTGQWKWEVEPKPAQTLLYQDGAWVKDNPGAPWVQVDSKQEGNGDAVAPFQEWLAQDGSATPTKSEAGTFTQTNFDGWTVFGTSSVDDPREYYLAGGAPTTDLTEANWFDPTTTTRPLEADGWKLLDKRDLVVKEATPDTTTTTTVVDQAAYDETVHTGVYANCPPTLAVTGGSFDDWGPAGLAGLGFLGLGTTLVALGTRRARRESGQ